MTRKRGGFSAFSSDLEALAFMAAADGYVTVLLGSSDRAVQLEAWPEQAQQVIDRINDPWPAQTVQSIW